MPYCDHRGKEVSLAASGSVYQRPSAAVPRRLVRSKERVLDKHALCRFQSLPFLDGSRSLRYRLASAPLQLEIEEWSGRRDSNSRHPAWKECAQIRISDFGGSDARARDLSFYPQGEIGRSSWRHPPAGWRAVPRRMDGVGAPAECPPILDREAYTVGRSAGQFRPARSQVGRVSGRSEALGASREVAGPVTGCSVRCEALLGCPRVA